MLAWYRSVIALRRAEPALSDPRLDLVSVAYDADARWVVVTRGDLRVACNLSSVTQDVPVNVEVSEVLLASDSSVTTAPQAVSMPAESVAIVRMAGS